MAIEELIKELQEIPGVFLRPEESMAKHTPLRVGGPVELWVEACDSEGLKSFLSCARQVGGKWRIHWPFSDWLVRDGGLRGTVLRLGNAFEHIHLNEDSVELGSSALWSALPRELAGGLWDAIREWPGSVGGLFAHGDPSQLAALCTKVGVIRGGRHADLEWPEDGSPPRLGETTVLTSVTLRRVSASRAWLSGPRPVGTLFSEVDDSSVAKELDKAGVLGTRLRRWRLSTTEPGTVVHLGGGSFNDLQLLVKGIRMRVEKTRGVSLETRIPVLGNEPGKRNR